MSLTGMLNQDTEDSKELKRIIDLLKINPTKLIEVAVEDKKKPNGNIKAEYLLNNHSLAGILGTAFDYLARFVIKKYQYRLTKENPKDYYVSEFGLQMVLYKTDNYDNNYEEFYSKAIEIVNQYIEGDESEELYDRILGVTNYLAKLELIARSGYTKDREASLRNRIDRCVYQELKNQIAILEDEFEKKFKFKSKVCNIEYNPSFGRCSIAVGGADADIIINNTLIDFKTSKYLSRDIKKNVDQVLGYYLFYKVLDSKYNIDKICLYYSRFGKFIEYEFTDKDKDNILLATKEMTNFINGIKY